jgi:hypothetical protein
MKAYKLDLLPAERAQLRKSGVKIGELRDYAPDEICALMHISEQRGKELSASIQFQSIPSIGPKFAADLIEMGYYTLQQLKDKQGHELLDAHERLIGAWTDPCVEDQFRSVVHHANNSGSTKQWWDFTAERKAYRQQYGYPATRPQKAWIKLEKYQKRLAENQS